MDANLGFGSAPLKQGAAEGTCTSRRDVRRCPQGSRTRTATHPRPPSQGASSILSPTHPSALSAEVEGAASSSSILQGTGGAGRQHRHSGAEV